MPLRKGTMIKITKIQEKDYDWFDNQFEELSQLCNGQKGIILSHNKESLEYNERESYQVLTNCKDGSEKELEIELDEFEILIQNKEE